MVILANAALMTSRIADADENRLVFTLRFFKYFLFPREINENRSKVRTANYWFWLF